MKVPGRAPNPDTGRNPRSLARGRMGDLRRAVGRGGLTRENREQVAAFARDIVDRPRDYDRETREAAARLLAEVE